MFIFSVFNAPKFNFHLLKAVGAGWSLEGVRLGSRIANFYRHCPQSSPFFLLPPQKIPCKFCKKVK
jgi:hypothetical protein